MHKILTLFSLGIGEQKVELQTTAEFLLADDSLLEFQVGDRQSVKGDGVIA